MHLLTFVFQTTTLTILSSKINGYYKKLDMNHSFRFFAVLARHEDARELTAIVSFREDISPMSIMFFFWLDHHMQADSTDGCKP